MTIYVYAYDVYGARTYFTAAKIPKRVMWSSRDIEHWLRGVAAKKLGVPREKVRIGQYSNEKFDQGHLPHGIYSKGHWRSYTTND